MPMLATARAPQPPRAFPHGVRVAATALLAAALWLPAPAAAQGTWKWRDAQGRVTVSDRPPPASVPERDILGRPRGAGPVAPTAAPSTAATTPAVAAAASAASAAASAPAASAPVSELERRVQEQARAEEQAKAAQAAAEARRVAALRATNCQRARSSLATLDSGDRIVRLNARGEREVMDESTRNAERRRAQGLITENCR